MRILLVEDDLSLQKGIHFKLMKEGHNVTCCDCVEEAASYVDQNVFNMAILDVSLPDGDGYEVCKRIRKRSPKTHILFLTAKDAEMDIVMGYDMGADDYLTKPFSLSVLLGKCNAVTRRVEAEAACFTNEEVELDASKQLAYVRGEPVSLTRNEMRLLNLFLQNTGQILTKERLLQVLWDLDGNFVDENTLAVNIRRLREKVEEDPSQPKWIETVRGTGYRWKS